MTIALQDSWYEFVDSLQRSIYENNITLWGFLTGGTPPFTTKSGLPVLSFPDEQAVCVLQRGVLNDVTDRRMTPTLLGAITPQPLLVLNADEGQIDLNAESAQLLKVTLSLSFSCLSRFFHPMDTDSQPPLAIQFRTARALGRGTLQVVDWTPDVTRKLSANDQALRKHGRLPVAPAAGFTLVGSVWHQSASVLIHDTRKSGATYLLGQDEGTYFGCELATHPKTVKAAYTSLVPPAAKRHVARQGEWFVTPVADKDVPAVQDCTFVIPTYLGNRIGLPIENAHSAVHYAGAHSSSREVSIPTRVVGARLYTQGVRLSHSDGDHTGIELPGARWYTYDRNTAVRSFSEEGVD